MKAIHKSIYIVFFCSFLSNVNAQNFEWVKSFGSTGWEQGMYMTKDKWNCFYITGHFEDTVDFDPGPNTFNLISESSRDIFILKLDSAGNFIWAVNIRDGGPADMGRSISIDDNKNIYVTGHFNGTADFDPGPGIYNLTSAGGVDIFILKLDSTGNFLWAMGMGYGNNNYDVGQSLIADTSYVYITGTFNGTVDFDPGVATYNLVSAGLYDIFILKLDNAGNFQWAKKLGSTGYDYSNTIISDANGNIILSGDFAGTVDFDPGPGVYNLTTSNNSDYILKLDSAGNFMWVKSIGPIGTTFANFAPLINYGNNIYLAGSYGDITDFDPDTANTFFLNHNGIKDIFLLKLDLNGNFIWVRTMGGTGDDGALSIAIDNYEDIYITGGFTDTVDFDPGSQVYNLIGLGSYDLFTEKLDSAGNFIWAQRLGTINHEVGVSVAVDNSLNIYTMGFFEDTMDFDFANGVHNMISNGHRDVFITKWNQTNTGINEISNNDIFNIFPNPTQSTLKVALKQDENITIMNLLGEVIFEKRFSMVNGGIVELNVASLASGIYLIKAGNNVGKFVKE